MSPTHCTYVLVKLKRVMPTVSNTLYLRLGEVNEGDGVPIVCHLRLGEVEEGDMPIVSIVSHTDILVKVNRVMPLVSIVSHTVLTSW